MEKKKGITSKSEESPRKPENPRVPRRDYCGKMLDSLLMHGDINAVIFCFCYLCVFLFVVGLWYIKEGKTQKKHNPNLSTINPLQLYRTYKLYIYKPIKVEQQLYNYLITLKLLIAVLYYQLVHSRKNLEKRRGQQANPRKAYCLSFFN